MSLINPYISGLLVGAIQNGTWRDVLYKYVCLLIGVTLFRTALRYCMLLIFESTSQRITLHLRQDIYKWVHSQNYGFFDANRVGDIMARMTGDLEAVRILVAYDIYASFENVIIFVAASS